MNRDFTRIVLTGGPCAGKSTALDAVAIALRDLGCHVYMVNETATQFIMAGFNPPKMTQSQLFTFQANLLKQQIQTEDNLADIAMGMNHDGPIVFLCDRGALDSAAFLNCEVWDSLLGEYNWSEIKLGGRYDGVVHLATAADGAGEHYSLANNPARSETPELAIKVDNRLRKIWVGHEHYRYIDNSDKFTEKLGRVISACTNIVGIPYPMEIERKFLIKGITRHGVYELLKKNNLIYDTVNIEQSYLIKEDGLPERIRRRGKNGVFAHYSTSKFASPNPGDIGLIEDENRISTRAYYDLLSYKREDAETIVKDRICAIYKSIVIEIDYFKNPEPCSDFVLVESEVDIEKDLPKTEIIRDLFKDFEVIDVTTDKNWKNAVIAKKGFKNV